MRKSRSSQSSTRRPPYNMSSLLVPLVVLWAAVLVWSNDTTVQIVRNPSKVAIAKPDPLPVENNSTVATSTEVPAVVTKLNSTSDEWAEIYALDEKENTLHCTRQDYEEDVFSMTTLEKPIFTTYYNATLWAESRLVVTVYGIVDDKNLTLISQNITECIRADFEGAGLSPGALGSLAG